MYSPDDRLTIMLVNRYDRDVHVSMAVDSQPPARQLRIYRYTPQTLEAAQESVAWETVRTDPPTSESTSVIMPAHTFALLTDIPEGEE